MAPDRAGGRLEDRAGDRWDGSLDRAHGTATSAGAITTLASSVRRRMPKRQARTDASTTPPSERRLLRSGVTLTMTGGDVVNLCAATQLCSSSRRDVLSATLTFHAREFHELFLDPLLRRRSDETAALPAVSPTRPPAATKPDFPALGETFRGMLDIAPSGRSSESLTGRISRCRRLSLVWNGRIGSPVSA
jgi:hypothetical protein